MMFTLYMAFFDFSHSDEKPCSYHWFETKKEEQ